MPMPRRWPRCYYTYVMYDPDGVPYYVGAGKNNRANPEYKWFQGIQLEKEFQAQGRHTLTIIFEQENKEVAFKEERRFIKKIGRRDLRTGPLYNRTGGHGSHGRVRTEEERVKSRAAKIGRKVSPETRAKLSERMKGNQHLLGHIHSEETKQKLSLANKGRKLFSTNNGKKLVLTNEERLRRATHALTLDAGNRKGKKCSEEHKRKLSEAAKRRHSSCM